MVKYLVKNFNFVNIFKLYIFYVFLRYVYLFKGNNKIIYKLEIEIFD